MREFNRVGIDLGTVKIHRKAIADIVYSALSEIKGIKLISKNFLYDLYELVGINDYPGISVNVDKNNQVTIDVKICVDYGKNVPDMATLAQEAIRSAVERTVDIDLKVINVNIHGIERREL